MNLLLLGMNSASLPLLHAIGASERFRVVGCFKSDDVAGEVARLFRDGRRISDVAEFVRATTDAAVLVGNDNGTPQREQLLRELARDSVPLILQHPACSAIFAVELDMIQRDTTSPMIPLHPASLHPAVDRMADWLHAEELPIGNVEQIVLERHAHDRSDDVVRATLARDAMLLRRLVGDFQKVGAMQSAGAKSLANLSVHLTGDHPAMTRWTIGPVNDFTGATLALIGDQGRVTLRMPDDGDWHLDSTSAELATTLPPHDDSAALLTQIESALENSPVRPTWEDAFRSLDLAHTASESVRRGKTLAINNARLTEEDTFKSMMAAGGCLILMLLPLLLLMVSLVDGMQIPLKKETSLVAGPQQRTVPLPADSNAVRRLQIVGSDVELRELPPDELVDQYGVRQVGTPQAYSVSRNDLTLAPIPDKALQLNLQYEGSFNIWKGWPLLLLTPIALFLALQLLKLVFPKRAT